MNERSHTDLENYLYENYMTQEELAKKIGCHRILLTRINQGIAVRYSTAQKVYEITNGKVKPVCLVPSYYKMSES